MSIATNPNETLLECQALDISAGDRRLVATLNLTISRGDWIAVLGKNGAGKTLTLETLCGLRRADCGEIVLDGNPLSALNANTRARRITMVTQTQDDAFSNRLLDNVLLGRYPHIGRWQRECQQDRELAMAQLAALDLSEFAERDVQTLSGGERQRAAIAQALTQDTPVLLLDEPLSQLDPANARDTLRLLKARNRRGYTIIMSLHDVNVAALCASHVLLLQGDGNWQFGRTEQTLNADNLSALYDIPMLALRSGGRTIFSADPRALADA